MSFLQVRASLGDVFFGARCSCPDGRGEEPNGKESGSAPWQWKGQDDQSEDDEGQATSKLILTERNPWLTPTESCATEQEEERLVRAPLASDRLETQLARCQCGGPANAENHLHPSCRHEI